MSDETKSEPIAYLHTLDSTDGIEENEPSRRLTFSPENPFGKPGVNYSEEYPWTVEPLYRGGKITRLRSDLATVTAERDRMREALRPFDDFPLHKWDGIGDDHVLYGPFTLGHVRKYLSGSCQAILDNSNYPEKPDSCARAAIEGVTENKS